MRATLFLMLLAPLLLSAQDKVNTVTGEGLNIVVQPLLSDEWGEGSPCNNLCPVCANGKNGVVGCGALSTAQIMHYWRWPMQGVGSNTYTCKLDSDPNTTIELSADFGDTTYEWNKMLDVYTSAATDEEKAAVAMLCYHVGVSLNMDYGTGGSPNSKLQVTALNRHFRYYAKRITGKSDEEYAELMRHELDAGRPVLFHGENENSTRTHTFVCDGYAEDGYFHFNFGYWGSYNGYYRLEELKLTESADFRYHHRMTYDIRPYHGEIPMGMVELTVTEPGTLQTLIDGSAAPFATQLKVNGRLNGADISALRRLLGRDDNNMNSGGILTDLDLSNASFVPGSEVYYQRTDNGVLSTYTITDATALPDCSFRNTNLRRIVLPASVTAIGSMAFYACYSLKEVDYGASVTTIGPSALRNTGLKEVTVPEQVTAIEQWAFGDNAQLEKVHIGSRVARINYSAFNRCPLLREVMCDIALPFYIQNNVFADDTFSEATLHVPAGTRSLYRRTQYWRLFSNIVEQEGVPLPQPYLVMPSWKAGEPFNGDVPTVDGQHLVVGCGTVATSQILGYYRQPAHGFGRARYTSSCEGITTDIDADFEAHPFDWNNILDVYSDQATSQQQAAVANLVNMTSAAIRTQYGSTYGTIVNYGSWMAGMCHFLHFSPTMRYRYRKYYSSAEWTGMIDEQIGAGRPIIYNSQHTRPFASHSAHIFILDGRDDEGRYHFNFGYDNSSVDKFTSLNAINQGSEAKAGNCFTCWHHSQRMVTDCYPVEGLSDADYPRCEVSLSEPFVLEGDAARKEISVTGRVLAKFQYRCISFDADNIQYSLGFYRGQQLAGVSPSWRQNYISIGGGVSNVNRYFLLPDNLPDGNYEMALVSRTSEDDAWRRGWDNVPNSVPVNVSGQTFTFHMPDYHNGPAHLYLKKDVEEIVGARDGGRTFEFTIANPSTNNFEDTLRVTVTNARGQVFESSMPTSVYDGQSLPYRYFIPEDQADFMNGNFTIALHYHETATGAWMPLTDSPSGIVVTTSTAATRRPAGIYTLGGIRVAALPNTHSATRSESELLPSGLYVVCLPDGTVRKIVLRRE